MSAIDAIASTVLLSLAACVLFVLQRGFRRRRFYARRGPLGRLVVLGASSTVVIVVATWAPIAVIRYVAPPTTSFMAQRMLPCRGVDYDWVEWAALSPHTPIAFVAAEDQRFPQHHGFDLVSIQQAMTEAESGKRARGASTISQQVVKNLFLWPGRSWVRKGLEAWGTVLVELTWPKRRILEVYVNTAQLGPCTFGVGAAARRFFDEEAEALGPSESALLAAVLPSPERYRVDAPSEFVQRRQAWIEKQVRNLGGASYLATAETRPSPR